MYLEMAAVESFSPRDVISHCSKYNCTLVLSPDRLCIFKNQQLKGHFTFDELDKQMFLPTGAGGHDVRVSWSEEVQYLFCLWSVLHSKILVFLFDGFEVVCIAALVETINGVQDCCFLGRDNLLVQSRRLESRLLVWNLPGKCPVSSVDSIEFFQGLPSTVQRYSRDFFLLVDRAADSKTWISMFSLGDSFRRCHSFPIANGLPLSKWSLSSDGTRVFALTAAPDCRFYCHSLSQASCLFEVSATGDRFFVDFFVMDAKLGAVFIFDCDFGITAIDWQTGARLASAVFPLSDRSIRIFDCRSNSILSRQVGEEPIQCKSSLRSVSIQSLASTTEGASFAALTASFAGKGLLEAKDSSVLLVLEVATLRVCAIFLFSLAVISSAWYSIQEELTLAIVSAEKVFLWRAEEVFAFETKATVRSLLDSKGGLLQLACADGSVLHLRPQVS